LRGFLFLFPRKEMH